MENLLCEKCNYSLASYNVKCPNCGAELPGKSASKKLVEDSQVPMQEGNKTIAFSIQDDANSRNEGLKTVSFNGIEPQGGNPTIKFSLPDDEEVEVFVKNSEDSEPLPALDSNKTVMNIWELEDSDDSLIDEPDEASFSLITDKGKRTVNFSGDFNELNRSSLDPENNSISEQGHIKISKQGDSWMIENTAESGFTFVQLKGSTEVEDGDIIIVGNKHFIFKSQQQ